MTRLIDADAITYGSQLEYQHDGKWENTLMVYKTDIDEQPTVDAVPVIRCKDCVYFTPKKSGEHWNVCRFYDAPKTADGYCNDAERKEE